MQTKLKINHNSFVECFKNLVAAQCKRLGITPREVIVEEGPYSVGVGLLLTTSAKHGSHNTDVYYQAWVALFPDEMDFTVNFTASKVAHPYTFTGGFVRELPVPSKHHSMHELGQMSEIIAQFLNVHVYPDQMVDYNPESGLPGRDA